MTATQTLTPAQREEFVARGFTVLRGAFSGEAARAWTREECAREGYDLDDPATWREPYMRLKVAEPRPLDAFSPAAWVASVELMGGPERVASVPSLGVLAVNLAQGADRPFEAASSESSGWHKDGWHFRHFLDSPDQALLGIPLLTDVNPRGGATSIAAGSVGPVARFLADHPEGVSDLDIPYADLLREPGVEFVEATGEAGDFYLLHPYLLHAVSQNTLRAPRAICNIVYEVREPLRFDRPTGEHSPVEEAVLRGLGVESAAFAPTRERVRNDDYAPLDPRYKKG